MFPYSLKPLGGPLEERLRKMTNVHQTKIPCGGIMWKSFTYIQKVIYVFNVGRAWLMKGTCLIWSRGRHFSPFPARQRIPWVKG